MRNAMIATAALILIAASVWAQTPSQIGDEFQVNSFTTSTQNNASVAPDALGRFIVVWAGSGATGSQVWRQHYDADGAPHGGNIGAGFWIHPSVASDDAGNFVIVQAAGVGWIDGDGYGIVGARYDSTGSMFGDEFAVNTYTTGNQWIPRVAMNGAGEFVVVWVSDGQDGDDRGVFGQKYDSAGLRVGAEFQVNTYTTHGQRLAFSRDAVAIDASGGFVVTWQSDYLPAHFQRYDAAANPLGANVPVAAGWDAIHPAVGQADSGDFVVAWTGYGSSGNDIMAQRFSSAGDAVGASFQVNTYANFDQSYPSVSMAGDGAFVVVWQSSRQEGALDDGVFGRLFTNDGTALGEEFQVNTYTTAAQTHPDLALTDTGGFMVVWESNGQDGDQRGIFGQLFSAWIFADGFESGSTSRWSDTVPGA